jgi:hypothetical protein
MLIEKIAVQLGTGLFYICKVAGAALANILDKAVDKAFEQKDENNN